MMNHGTCVSNSSHSSTARRARSRAAVALGSFVLLGATLGAPAMADAETYIVLYEQYAVPGTAGRTITNAGGTLVASYAPIGVAIARSDNPSFAATVRATKGVHDVAATSGLAVKLDGALAVDSADPDVSVPAAPTPAPGGDNLSGLQWDMDQIHAPDARAINGGSPSVVVGDIDTGIDYTHPDLAPNVDDARSVNCVSGAPVQGMVAAYDDNGHGTHTAGTIAAAKNGIGIVGVAPNVKIAGIKAGNADGFFFPEAVVCAFMWVATKNIQVTNNSYFADPWLFDCRNDPTQRAIWEAERRAIAYAMQKGAVVVAAAGNMADDLTHPTQDVTSPDNTTPITRSITNACAVVPVEIPGVVGVTANGNLKLKSFYSSYGIGSIEVTAPGGDSLLQRTAASPNGRVLSTWPAAQPCARKVVDGGAVYCYLQGTSMASPHVAGVAALIASTGVASPAAVAARLVNTADPLACPTDPSIYAFFPSISNGAAQTCVGGIGYNGFNGKGQVDALAAVLP
jgi:lantibiotic leader peptide-processing serine protease